MNLLRTVFLILILHLLGSETCFSQYILNGSAQKNSCNCYTLTPATTTQSGSVWNSNKISLNNPFDFWFNVFLGCNDGGADGIVFILQPISTSVGSSGEGMGFGGVSPSIGIALDTYQNLNLNDPAYDHISIQANGVINHNSDLAGPIPISASSDNVEDCQWHVLRISWDPVTKWLKSYFDGILRVQKQVDLVTTIFNNDPNVFWGFTGATGGSVNLQQFCTALDPDFTTNHPNNVGCAPASFQFNDQSISFAPLSNYDWDFGDGGTSTLQNPSHNYLQPGNYQVRYKIRALDGCENDTTETVIIGSNPDANFSIFDTCFKNDTRILFSSAVNVGLNYEWKLDGNIISTTQDPHLNSASPGVHQLQLIVSSQYQCGVPDTATSSFAIKPLPQIETNNTKQCQLINFTGTQIDNATTIIQWNWNFGDNHFSNTQNPAHYFAPGQYSINTWALGDNGCSSDTIQKIIDIPFATAFAGNDTVVITNLPFQLHATGNGNFQWTPTTGLSDASIAAPMATVSDHQDYFLTVTTAEGCVAKDTIRIKAFAGPTIYVPSAFTPNHDGLNDVLLPIYVGINRLDRFTIYNRWGQMVFTTKNFYQGWDGSLQQKNSASGTYVWLATGEDYLHHPFLLKGTITIIQ